VGEGSSWVRISRSTPSVAEDKMVPCWCVDEAISRAVVVVSSYAVEPRKSKYRNEDLLRHCLTDHERPQRGASPAV
jgi:hypothetical protein